MKKTNGKNTYQSIKKMDEKIWRAFIYILCSICISILAVNYVDSGVIIPLNVAVITIVFLFVLFLIAMVFSLINKIVFILRKI